MVDSGAYFLIGYIIFLLGLSLYLHIKLDNTFSDCLYRVMLIWPMILIFGIDHLVKTYPALFKYRKKKEDNK